MANNQSSKLYSKCVFITDCKNRNRGLVPPCAKLVESTKTVRPKRAKQQLNVVICSNNICTYCIGSEGKKPDCSNCYDNSDFVGRKLSTI